MKLGTYPSKRLPSSQIKTSEKGTAVVGGKKWKSGKIIFKHNFSGQIATENAVNLSEWHRIRICEKLLINSIALWACLGSDSLKVSSLQKGIAFFPFKELLFAFTKDDVTYRNKRCHQ